MDFGTHAQLVLLALLVAAAALLVVAPTLGIPYPILLVLGGLALGFLPGVPTLQLPPELVLIAILPPLLYSSAFFTSLRELRANVRPIGLLAIGLVITTMVAVAVGRPRAGRRHVVGRGVRAGSSGLTDGSDRGDGDHAPAGRATPSPLDRRGREPRERRHRTRVLPRRGHGGGRRHVLASGTRPGACSGASSAESPSASSSAFSSPRFGDGSTIRRSR